MRFLISIFILLLIPGALFAADENLDVHLTVDACNNNNICESGIGENVSNCSNDCSVVPGGVITSSGSIYFYDVVVAPDYTTAHITWRSFYPTLSTLRWGTGVEYRSGTLRKILFLREHSATITGLTPNTRYYFSIEGIGIDGAQPAPYQGSFSTLVAVDTTPPQNPLNVSATPNKSSITVKWKNPPDADFENVRIMRMDNQFSANPFDGKLVYEGRGQYVTDSDVVVEKNYFYTLFAKDITGNYSSGVGAQARIRVGDGVYTPPTRPTRGDFVTSVVITQNDAELPIKDNSCDVNGDHSVVIFVQLNDMPKRDLWLDLQNKDGKSLGYYLFSYDPGTQKYRVKLPSLLYKGDYRITIFGYFERKEVELWRGTLRVSHDSFSIFSGGNGGQTGFAGAFVYFVFFFILVLIIWLIIKRRKRREK